MVKIEDIENITIQQGSFQYKLICEKDEWVFVDINNGKRHGNYSRESAYRVIMSNQTKLINVPVKAKIYELW